MPWGARARATLSRLVDESKVESVVEWLVNGAPGAPRSPDVLEGVTTRLRQAGIPIEHAEAFVRTLHPHIVGRSFVWEPGSAVEVRENSYAYLHSAEFQAGPVGRVFRTGEWVRRRLCEALPEAERAVLGQLAERGFTELVAAPFHFLSGQVHAVAFATKVPGGFTDGQIAAMRRVVPPLSRIAEILALSRTAANLLSTYVGRAAGERILAGQIQRGDIEPIRAVIWFSDLRGFTSLAAQVTPGELIVTLNEVFDCQVPAIEQRGGEVLKFMGDGMLAILPLQPGDSDASERCAAALDAAKEALAALEALNTKRAGRGQPAVRFGLALHVGEVAYGNIGGAGRLDFTCIGPAVNLAARLEGLTGQLKTDVVVSEAFAELAKLRVYFRDLGTFELKGVGAPQRVFAP